MMNRILIIEDDMDLREGLAYFLGKGGYEVLTAGTKRAGMEIIRKALCDLILLDCNLPDGSGFDLCTEAKEYGNVPILMLTARDTEMDEVKALEMGVADYMSKPFSIAVLKARIKKILQGRKPETRLVSGGITLEKEACKVYKNGEEIRCSKVEYQLLMYFMENRGRVLSKEQILAHVWDSQGKFVDENTLSVNIRRLRGKIEDDPKHPALIRTVHGIGYVWRKEEE